MNPISCLAIPIISLSLGHPFFAVRPPFLPEGVSRGDKPCPVLSRLIHDADLPLSVRVATVGALHLFRNEESREAFLALLGDPEPVLRRLAADGLALKCQPRDETAHTALLRALGDEDPAVRRAVALAMGRIGADGAADALVNALAFDNGKDPALREGLIQAVELLGGPGVERLLALADSGVEKDLATVVEAFHRMRTRPAAEALPTLLKNPHLRVSQRAELVRAGANYLLSDPSVSIRPILDYLLTHPDEAIAVRQAGLFLLEKAGPLPREEKVQAWVLEQLKESDRDVRQAAIRVLGARPEGARLVGRYFLDKKLPRDFLPQVAEALRRHAEKDPDAAALLAEVLKSDP